MHVVVGQGHDRWRGLAALHDALGVLERRETHYDVDEALLAERGAVSPEVAVAMARGARRAAGADYAVALSGIAGPSGGSPHKPVGTVELAVDTPEGTWYRPLRMRPYWGRTRIRSASATAALALLLKLLEGRVGDDPKAVQVTDDNRAES